MLDFSLLLHYNMFVATKKGGSSLGLHKGAKLTENPKDFMLRVRLDKETLDRLNKCCEKTQKSRSEIVRLGIQEQYAKIKD